MSRPVRVLQVVDSLQPGGMENMLVQILSRLDPAVIQSEVLCLTRGGAFESRLPAGMKVHVMAKKDGFHWEVVMRLRKLLAEGGYDVVHTHHLGGLIFFALAAGLKSRPRLVHSEHMLWSGDDLSRKRQWQRRILYPRASVIFTVSQKQLDQMSALGFRHRKMMTIINGVDSDRFRPTEGKAEIRRALKLDPNAQWLGMVARFGSQKRHLDLIQAFEQIAPAQPGVNLLLVGDGGPERERVLAALESSPWKSRIHWAGFQLDPVRWYQAMDVLVVSSSNEGMPNAVLEGMACGLPLMANDVCGVREIAIDGEHGRIMDLGTVEKLAAGLQIACTFSAEELKRFGSASRRHVQRQFSVEATVKKYHDLFVGTGSLAEAKILQCQ